MKKISSPILALILACYCFGASAETKSFRIEEIQTVTPGPDAVHPRENPIGGLTGLVDVEFSLAFVDDTLQFYATVYDSPDAVISFNVSAGIYYNNDQKIGYFRQSPTFKLPAKSGLFPIGGTFYKTQGDFEPISKSDLEMLQDLRLEVTWHEKGET